MSSSPTTSYDIAIIGGGVGGLALAAALHHLGIASDVFEQWPDFAEAGGHVTIDDAAIASLDQFGLGQSVADEAVMLKGFEVRKIHGGDVLMHIKLPDIGQMGVDDPARMGSRVASGILRSDLVKVFAAQIPPERMHAGKKLTAVSDGEDWAEATFEDGATIRAKLLVGADGVQSIVRRIFDDAPSTPIGITTCRVNAPGSVLPPDIPNDRLRLWDGGVDAGEGAIVLTCPVRAGEDVAIDMLLVGGDQLDDVDKSNVPPQRLIDRLPEGADPRIADWINSAEEPVVAHRQYDRDPATSWSGKHLTILGDAAHAMRPNLGQGACQSIHDAAELARSIAEHGPTTEALVAYEGVREPYAKQVVAASKQSPPRPELWDDDVKTQAHDN